jgi:aminobenzoyl-glutamate utilization protein B
MILYESTKVAYVMDSELTGEKREAIEWLEDHRSELADLNDEIWGYAEPGMREYRSAAAHEEYLSSHGFEIESGAAGMPTSFVAEHGSGSPVLGFFAEYDATPGDSQKAVPHQERVAPEAAGYGDMHNGLGVGSTGAVCALKQVKERHDYDGTIRLYGTPAEKLVLGKAYFAREGYFDDLDAVIGWHPRPYSTVEKGHGPSPCREFIVDFEGESFYSAKPWHGVNALDAATMYRIMLAFMKDSFPPHKWASISDVLARGGQHPTRLPERAQSWITARAADINTLDEIEERLRQCAEAVSLFTGCTVDVRTIAAIRPWLNNETLADLAYENLQLVGPPSFTEEDKEFARAILDELDAEVLAEPFQEELTDPDRDPTSDFLGGADDINEFCWHAPTCRIYVSYQFDGHYNKGYPNWASAALARTNVAHEALTTAAKAMATTAIDLLVDEEVLERAQREYEERTADEYLGPQLPDDAEPPYDETIPPFYPEGWEPPTDVGRR